MSTQTCGCSCHHDADAAWEWGQVVPPTVACGDPVGALTACSQCRDRHVDPPRAARPPRPPRPPRSQADGDG